MVPLSPKAQAIEVRAETALIDGAAGCEGCIRLAPIKELRPAIITWAEKHGFTVLETVEMTKELYWMAFQLSWIKADGFERAMKALEEIAEDPD